jgi:hypothetical protein
MIEQQMAKVGKPLVGHLLPYIPHERSSEYEVEVNATNGWLDTLTKV